MVTFWRAQRVSCLKPVLMLYRQSAVYALLSGICSTSVASCDCSAEANDDKPTTSRRISALSDFDTANLCLGYDPRRDYTE